MPDFIFSQLYTCLRTTSKGSADSFARNPKRYAYSCGNLVYQAYNVDPHCRQIKHAHTLKQTKHHKQRVTYLGIQSICSINKEFMEIYIKALTFYDWQLIRSTLVIVMLMMLLDGYGTQF